MRSFQIVLCVGMLSLLALSQGFAGSGFQADLVGNLSYVQKQILDLENSIPGPKMTWRPAEGVRSVSEVYSHIAFGNYLIAKFAGIAPPAGITVTGPEDEAKWEKITTDKAKIHDQLVSSFDFIKTAVKNMPDGDLEKSVEFFGNKMTVRAVLLVLVSHAHEHLGQSIAYARMVGVVPPWTAAQMEAAKAKK